MENDDVTCKPRIYSHSRKTLNTRENFWNVYCFATNQKQDETAEDNRQTAAWISHDLIQNNELGFCSSTNLQFYRFQLLKLFFFLFQLIHVQRIDMNDMFSDIYGKATLNRVDRIDQTRLDSASEKKKPTNQKWG